MKNHLIKKTSSFVLLILLSFALSFLSFAQTTKEKKDLFTLENAVYYTLSPKNIGQLHWRKNGYYVYQSQDGKELRTAHPILKIAEQTLISTTILSEKLGLSTPIRRLSPFNWIDENTAWFEYDSKIYIYNFESQSVKLVTNVVENASFAEFHSAEKLAVVIDNDIWLRNVDKDGKTDVIQITEGGSRELTYGEAAHRSEFGITKGLFWSNNAEKLAFYRTDRSMETDYPLIDYAPYPAKYTPIKYPMAGQKSHEATVGVYDTKNKKTVYLKTGESKVGEIKNDAEQYLTNITFSPDAKTIFIAIVNREQNHMKLNSYDANTGEKIKTLFEEKDDKYTEPQHSLYFMKNNPNLFVWQSQKDGYNHLYLYDIDGKLIRQLTKGNGIVTDIIGMDKEEKFLYFEAALESPIENHIYKTEIKTGKITKLTKEAGTHFGKLSEDGNYLLDSYSNLETPAITQIIDTRTSRAMNEVFKAENPLVNYERGQMEIFKLKADDGTELYSRVIKPTNFDSTKKYPVMIYVYGGPHVQLIQNKWLGGADYFMQYMAQQGYVIFTLDNRGSSNRGKDFEQATFRNLGKNEVSDQLKGVEWLKKQSYVDSNRLGVFGWSFGGFMTTSLLTKHPDLFKVGVAGGPVIDWSLYEIMYTERYMDTPQENPEGYKNANLLNSIENLKARLLVIHGLQDDVVVPQHTRLLINAAIENQILLDYFPYPSHPHNVRGVDRIHLYMKIAKYFEDFL